MNQSIFSQPEIITAIQNIVRRNEQMVDLRHVALSFYDDNVVSQLININNQSIQGRRGTGKTHLLRMLEATLREAHECVVYVDCRILGSAGTMQTDNGNYRTMHLFRDFVDEVVHKLKDYFSSDNVIFENEKDDSLFFKVQDQLDEIYNACTGHSTSDFEFIQDMENTEERKHSSERSFSVDIGKGFGFGFGGDKSFGKERREKRQTKYKGKETIVFPNISKNIELLTEQTKTRIYILIDEWSNIPYNIQPIFAEFLKRCFLCCQYITAKIAFVSHRTKFIEKSKSEFMGIELSAEMPCIINLDEMLVFDKNPGRVVQFMANLLIKQIQAYTGKSGMKLEDISSGFENSAFTQLVRASEGNPRDFINILTKCISQFSFDRGREPVITSLDIIDAAETWFYAEKYDSLSESAQESFYDFLSYVVFEQHTRGCFICDFELLNSDIGELIDSRVLHVVSKGHIYPGYKKRLALIILDYGAYCSKLKLGENLKLFRHDKWERLCEVPNSIGLTYIRKYWPYDGKREVVACVKELPSTESVLNNT